MFHNGQGKSEAGAVPPEKNGGPPFPQSIQKRRFLELRVPEDGIASQKNPPQRMAATRGVGTGER